MAYIALHAAWRFVIQSETKEATVSRVCQGGLRCHLGGDYECINGVRIDVDVYTEGWDRHVIYPPAPCHPNRCEKCGGSGDAPEDAETDDCAECHGTGYRGGIVDCQERLAETLED